VCGGADTQKFPQKLLPQASIFAQSNSFPR